METTGINTEREPAITVRVNPANRTVDTSSPEYQQAWTKKFNEVRDEIEAELKRKVEAGELTIEADSEGHLAQSADEAIRYMAHAQAEQIMQQWALRSAIGLVGVNEGYDHGRTIRYIDDPSVEPFSHQVVDAEYEEAQPAEPTPDDAIAAYRQIGGFNGESSAMPNQDREQAMQRFRDLMSLLTPEQRQTVWDQTNNLTEAE